MVGVSVLRLIASLIDVNFVLTAALIILIDPFRGETNWGLGPLIPVLIRQ